MIWLIYFGAQVVRSSVRDLIVCARLLAWFITLLWKMVTP